MAKSKKKKKVQMVHQRKAGKYSKTYLDACHSAARRIFMALGEDESTFDIFTKRQRQEMFFIVVMPPRIAVAPGHKVPKKYIRYIQDELVAFLKRTYFDKEQEVTWMDMVTVGQTMLMLFGIEEFLDSLPLKQREVVERMCEVFDSQNIFDQIYDMVENQIKITLWLLSQPNFRIYGQSSVKAKASVNTMNFQQIVSITSHECQSLRFKYKNKERTAFRIATGEYTDTPYTGAVIAMSKIFPGIKHDRWLDIYMQSHAIQRFKERIDTLLPIMRNEIFVMSFMLVQRVVPGPDGIQYIACIMPIENGEVTVGYFGFTIDGNNLLVLTLLPLLSNSVPEGRVLHDRLRLSTEDLKYLGMDKLSFFYDVDIEQIPMLKQVLFDELHLEYIRRDVYSSFYIKDAPFNEKKTLLVKNFFQKLEEQQLFNGMNEEQNAGMDKSDVFDD
jgi:hypothetical protein